MLKRYFIALTAVFLTFQLFVSSAMAVELSPELRTVPLNDKGAPVVLSLKQVQQGKRVQRRWHAQMDALGGRTARRGFQYHAYVPTPIAD